MGLNEDIKETYHRLGVMEERVRQLQNLDIPKKGDVAKDLGKAKDAKDFDKKKKDWQTKLDKVDSALKDVDSYFDRYTDQIKKVRTANSLGGRLDGLKQIDAVITQVEKNDEMFKKMGQPSPFGQNLKELNEQRVEYVEKQKALFNEVKKEMDSLWNLYLENADKFNNVKRDLTGEKEALKTAKFGSGAKVKAGAR